MRLTLDLGDAPPPAVLDRLVANFAALSPWIKPPVHSMEPMIDGQSDGQPALGWVTALEVVDGALVATVDGLHDRFRAQIEAGGIVAHPLLYLEWQATSGARNVGRDVEGPVVSSVALAGLTHPTCTDLACVCDVLLAEPVVARSLAEQPVADVLVRGFAESRHPPLARALAVVAELPPGLAAFAVDADTLPADVASRLELALKLLKGEDPMSHNRNRPTPLPYPHDEVAALAEATLRARGWPLTSEDARRRAVELVFAERPELNPSVRDDRQVERAVRYIASDLGLRPLDPKDRATALRLLAEDPEYADLRPVSWRKDAPPAPVAVPLAVPAIPPQCAPAVAKLSETLGVQWSTPFGRQAICTALGRQYPRVAKFLPPELRSPETAAQVRAAAQEEQHRRWIAAQSPYGG